MSIFVYCNLGVRDVLKDQQVLQPARSAGEALLQELQDKPALVESISLPIISPSIQYILDRHTEIERIFLLGTDQQSSSYARYILPR